MAEETNTAYSETEFVPLKSKTGIKRKPQNLTYGLYDTPPLMVTIVLALQHLCLLFIGILFPVLVLQQLGTSISEETKQSFISLTLLAEGIATFIQAYRIGPVGSGYFCPSISGPAYFDASKAAAAAGGLPLLFGMTLMGGVLESLFSRVMQKLRFLFPVEVTGLIVAMVGIVVLPVAIKNFFGTTSEMHISGSDTFVALVTFSLMIGLNVWTKGKLKLFCTLIGMVMGYLLAALMNLIPANDIQRLSDASYFSLPQLNHIAWAFDFSLLIPFAVATICSSFKTVGDLVTCQKINDANWKRPDMKEVSGGILADGLGGVIPGLLGGYGQSTSSSNVGMSLATGSTSRKIAIPLSIMFVLLAFFPKFSEIFIITPRPVMGAALVFSISFMITTGFQMMMSRMLDARKIFVIGASLIFGLSVDMVPGIYSQMHPWIKPVFNSTLSLATITALVLNLVFRIGISKKASLVVKTGDDISGKIFDFMERQGGLWGARKDIFSKATFALTELSEFLLIDKIAKDDLKINLVFDEFQLNVHLIYTGNPVLLHKERPSEIEILEKGGGLKLAGFLIYKYADKVKADRKGEVNTIHLYFEH